jgi:hypothetical protein
MISAQCEHLLLSPVARLRSSSAIVSLEIIKECGSAKTKIRVPYIHHSMKLRPLELAIAAGMQPMQGAASKSTKIIKLSIKISLTGLKEQAQIRWDKPCQEPI